MEECDCEKNETSAQKISIEREKKLREREKLGQQDLHRFTGMLSMFFRLLSSQLAVESLGTSLQTGRSSLFTGRGSSSNETEAAVSPDSFWLLSCSVVEVEKSVSSVNDASEEEEEDKGEG